MTGNRRLRTVALAGTVLALALAQVVIDEVAAARVQGAAQAPRFEVDPFWPKPLPNHWVLGNAIGVWVDARTTSGSSTAVPPRWPTTRRRWS